MSDFDDDERQLTPSERKQLRKMLEHDERAAWLWSSIRVWAGWVSAAVIAAAAMQQAVSHWIEALKRAP